MWGSLAHLQRAGITLFSQSVLLKGVNDNVNALKNLFEGLINHHIIPYYLHALDPVEGTSHFYVPDEEGIALIKQLRAILPGYAVPRFVREIPEMSSKTILA